MGADGAWSNQVKNLIILVEVPGFSGFFVYSPSFGTGNLDLSIAAAPGVDPEGNAYDGPGLEIQNGGSLWIVGPAAQQIVMSAALGVPIIAFESGRPEEEDPARIAQQLVNAGLPNEIIALLLSSAQVTAQQDEGFITLLSSAADGSSTAGVSLNYLDTSAVPHKYLSVSGAGVETFSSFAGDTDIYTPLRKKVFPAGSLTVNQTTFSQQVFPTLLLGVGTYIIEGQMLYQPNQAAGAAEFVLGTSTAVAGMRIMFKEFTTGTPFGDAAASEVSGFGSGFTGGTFGAAERFLEFRGTITCTTAGNIGLFAACTVAADTYTIRQQGSYLVLEADG